jgi:hypothetical protein
LAFWQVHQSIREAAIFMTTFINTITNAFSPRNNWKRFCALLGIFIVVRGILYLCILPPFEGWDEYQHVAYIQYLIEKNKTPLLDHAVVSRNLLARLTTYPQPRRMVDQTRSTGARDYASFFNSSSEIVYHDNHPDISLYQAQHGSLYYQIVRPLFILSGGISDLSQSISVLRFVNLLFVVFALMACFWFIHQVTDDRTQAALLMIVLACQPLYLINACRVANDALAVALGTVVIILALQKNWYDRKLLILLISFFLGLSIWIKMTNLPLGLFVLLTLLLGFLRKAIPLKRVIVVSGAVLLLTMITNSPNMVFNLRNYGMISPMKAVMINRAKGNGVSEAIASLSEINIAEKLRRIWTRESTWTGGWSFLSVKKAKNFVELLLYIAMAGWIFHLFRFFRKPLLFPTDVSIDLLLLVLCITIALGWKMIQIHLAWGMAGINAWYACVGLPFFLSLAYEGAGGWSRWGAIAFGCLMAVTYLFIEVYGAITQMLPTYSGGATGLEAIRRIALFHPGWLGLETIIFTSILFIALFFIITLTWLKDMGVLFRR